MLKLASLVMFVVVVAFSGQSAAAAAAAPKPTPDIFGIWVGVGPGRPDIDPRWSNKFFVPSPEFTAWGAAESKRITGVTSTPGQCDIWSPVNFMNASGLFPLQVLKASNQIVMLYEAVMQPRRIYTDGRGHPPDLDPTWLGSSIGHWEGDTLVIDTVALNGRGRPLNGYASGRVTDGVDTSRRLPYSDQMHVVERIRLVDGGRFLEDVMTVTDPKTYVRPFTNTTYFERRPDIDMLEFVCVDNTREDAEGQTP